MGTCSCSNATYAPPVAANNWNNQGAQGDPSKMGSQAGAAFNDVIKGSAASGDSAQNAGVQGETHDQQQARENARHEQDFRDQQEREAQEHGVAPSGTQVAGDPGILPPLPDNPGSNNGPTDTPPPAVGGVDQTNPPVQPTVAEQAPGSTSGAPGSTSGLATNGAYPFRPVELNGGANSEPPTTTDQIDGIINGIDRSLLSDPSQAGVGALNGLPYGKLFEASGKASGIDPALLYGDAQVESGDNPNHHVLAPTNFNPIQTNPGVWATSDNPATNVFMGAYVINRYINESGGNVQAGLNKYNTGDPNPSNQGFADGFGSYYDGVNSAYQNVQAAVLDPSKFGPQYNPAAA